MKSEAKTNLHDDQTTTTDSGYDSRQLKRLAPRYVSKVVNGQMPIDRELMILYKFKNKSTPSLKEELSLYANEANKNDFSNLSHHQEENSLSEVFPEQPSISRYNSALHRSDNHTG